MDNTKGEYEVVISTVAPPSVDKEYLDNYIKDRLKLLFRDRSYFISSCFMFTNLICPNGDIELVNSMSKNKLC